MFERNEHLGTEYGKGAAGAVGPEGAVAGWTEKAERPAGAERTGSIIRKAEFSSQHGSGEAEGEQYGRTVTWNGSRERNNRLEHEERSLGIGVRGSAGAKKNTSMALRNHAGADAAAAPKGRTSKPSVPGGTQVPSTAWGSASVSNSISRAAGTSVSAWGARRWDVANANRAPDGMIGLKRGKTLRNAVRAGPGP